MPQRTNTFQQLMDYIYSQMVPVGATVAQSALVGERTSGTEREVDILIEHEVAGIKLRIAVECRSGSRSGRCGGGCYAEPAVSGQPASAQ